MVRFTSCFLISLFSAAQICDEHFIIASHDYWNLFALDWWNFVLRCTYRPSKQNNYGQGFWSVELKTFREKWISESSGGKPFQTSLPGYISEHHRHLSTLENLSLHPPISIALNICIKRSRFLNSAWLGCATCYYRVEIRTLSTGTIEENEDQNEISTWLGLTEMPKNYNQDFSFNSRKEYLYQHCACNVSTG